MSQFGNIRTGLAARLATISGLRTYAYMPDNPVPPCAVTMPLSVSYDTAMNRGLDEIEWEVLVMVVRSDEETAQKALDAYCDPTSASAVKTAVEADPTLGGAVTQAIVTDLTSYQTLAVGEQQYLAATFRISIIAN